MSFNPVITGLASAAKTTLYKAVTGSSSLVQFQDELGNTIVQFDATMTEQYSTEARATEFPVEDGASIADNIIRAPLTIDMTAIVSDSPISGEQNLLNEATTVAASLTLPPIGIIGAAVAYATYQAYAGSDSPSKAAYANLYRLQVGDPSTSPPVPPEPFRVVTKLGVFENMMLTRLSVPRDTSTGGALIFNLSLTQINVVIAQTISISALDIPALAAAKVTAGEQAAKANDNLFRPGFIAGVDIVTSTASKLGISVTP
jgi:hypothetical protein